MFITIITTAVRRLVLWKAQNGAYLVELEQLQASISLPSTMKAALSLRAFRIRTAVLLLIWSFYYIGSQASKREFGLTDSAPYHILSAAYTSPNAPSEFAGNLSDLDIGGRNQYMIMYLLSTGVSEDQGYDGSGSVLVPSLEVALDPYGSSTELQSSVDDTTPAKPDAHGWVDVSRSSNNVWTSYVGLQLYVYDDRYGAVLSGYENERVMGDFEFATSYTTLNCSHPVLQKYEAFPDGTLSGLYTSLNMSSHTMDTNGSDEVDGVTNLELWYRWNYTDYYSRISYQGSWRSLCGIETSHVEVKVHCGMNGCSARSMRFSKDYNLLKRETPFKNADFASAFLSNLLLSTGAPDDPNGSDSLVEANIAAVFAYDQTTASWQDIGSTMRKISLFLERLINTYYALSQPENIHLSLQENQEDPTVALTTLHGAIYDPQYRISVPWIIADFISCAILLVAALASFWLRRRTLAPDIFGYVSSSTRDNPYLDLPEGGSTLSGLDRARLLKNVKIKIADVSANHEEAGRIGVSHSREVPLSQSYLNGERLYA